MVPPPPSPETTPIPGREPVPDQGLALSRPACAPPSRPHRATRHRAAQAGPPAQALHRPIRRIPAQIDPLGDAPDPGLVDRYGAAQALRDGVLPWRKVGQDTVVLVAETAGFLRHQARLRALFGPVRPMACPARQIEAALFATQGPALALAAENRTAPQESFRSLNATRLGAIAAGLALAVVLALALAPLALLCLVFALAALALLSTTALRGVAALAALRQEPAAAPPPVMTADLPTISILVTLYHEADIAPRLVRRLGRLDYPRDRLDVVIAVEADDDATREALLAADLPGWMRLITVPQGRLRTKPRALNLALDCARGSIIGIYDAEDAPDPDQLRIVAAYFAMAPADLACLQARLDFYNPRGSWIARCFTMEYALWFRLVLPGLGRLGLPVPLGGTSLFLRRAVIEDLGGWDAHNVTEDADLGLRLARHGYRTALLPTATGEEATTRPLPWVRQRSRWIKGYMMTWLVHMRDPALCWRQLGPRGFAGFQLVFLGSLLQFLLAPVLWSLWTVPLGLGHPLAAALPPALISGLAAAFLLCEAMTWVLTIIALRLTTHRLHWLWIPSLHLYFPLATLAAAKALGDLFLRPFHWDKTQHGLDDHAPGD